MMTKRSPRATSSRVCSALGRRAGNLFKSGIALAGCVVWAAAVGPTWAQSSGVRHGMAQGQILAVSQEPGGATNAATATMPPDVLVKTVSSEVLDIIRSDQSIQSGNKKRVIDLVQDKVLPHFDFTRMTALAVGPGWRRASPEQQKQLVDAFRTLLVRTYSSGLGSYRNQTIEFMPLRASPDATDVVVRSEVKQASAQPIPIDYRMEKRSDGWKVYDVSIGGVSLVTTYRDSFGQEVRQHGIEGLIKTLAEKNKQLEESKQS